MEKRTEKILVLGVDGFEPSLAKKFMDEGKMPNLKKFVERGSAREDLVLLGGMPTVTPPMWTTLATGANPRTHGITQFFNPHPTKLDTMVYALDSRLCRAEQVWNVLSESGKKTMVWHWPGSSWPPTSDSPNLSVVDGTQPTAVNLGVGVIDWEKLGEASVKHEEIRFLAHNENQAAAGCVITDMEDYVVGEEENKKEVEVDSSEEGIGSKNTIKSLIGGAGGKEFTVISSTEQMTEINVMANINYDHITSPIKDPKGWANAPEGAKEFTMITSAGLVRRPCLILKNEDGVYDRVAVYKKKKDLEPIAVLENGVYKNGIVDEIKVEEATKIGNRSMCILELSPDGSFVRYWMSVALDVNQDAVFHPKSILKEVNEKVAPVVPICLSGGGGNIEYIEKMLLPSLDYYCQWQADCLTHFMDNGYEAIFSHLHNVDKCGHQFWHYAKHRDEWNNDEKVFQGFIEYLYTQTDEYLGRFVKYLDEDWTIMVLSDHGLITEENHPPLLGEMSVNVPVMKELGYTYLKTDKEGKEIGEIDWSRTKAVVVRSGHLYINLKGRNPEGIVDPKDKYELEAEIISALYGYRDKRTGKRAVAIALRNKDAIILGMGGDRSGDIVFFMEEGFNIIHADSLSTAKGYFDTSVSPIFVAAGKGIKEGYTIERDIRQVDVAPTISVLGGIRMPAQCEGAPMYQLLTEEM